MLKKFLSMFSNNLAGLADKNKNYKQVNIMGRLISSFSKAKLICLVLGLYILYMSTGEMITSIKPIKSFEDVANGEVKPGDRVSGNVIYALDYFAAEQTWKEGNGSRTPKKDSSYYYLIPGNDSFAALQVFVRDSDAMRALVDETYAYMFENGPEPTAEMPFTGKAVKMESEYAELVKYFKEEITAYGYSEQEIAAMGDPILIIPRAFGAVRIMFGIGLVLVLLVVLLVVRDYRRFA
ncbi:DUF6709 family protein [Lachnospiraceae bacterium 62-35]